MKTQNTKMSRYFVTEYIILGILGPMEVLRHFLKNRDISRVDSYVESIELRLELSEVHNYLQNSG